MLSAAGAGTWGACVRGDKGFSGVYGEDRYLYSLPIREKGSVDRSTCYLPSLTISPGPTWEKENSLPWAILWPPRVQHVHMHPSPHTRAHAPTKHMNKNVILKGWCVCGARTMAIFTEDLRVFRGRRPGGNVLFLWVHTKVCGKEARTSCTAGSSSLPSLLISGEPKAPVVIRFEGPILVESQILGLLICQLCQVGIKGGQVEACHVLIWKDHRSHGISIHVSCLLCSSSEALKSWKTSSSSWRWMTNTWLLLIGPQI